MSISQQENWGPAFGESVSSLGSSGLLRHFPSHSLWSHCPLNPWRAVCTSVIAPFRCLMFRYKSGVMYVQKKHWLKLHLWSQFWLNSRILTFPPGYRVPSIGVKTFSFSGIRAEKQAVYLKTPTTNRSQSIMYRRKCKWYKVSFYMTVAWCICCLRP